MTRNLSIVYSDGSQECEKSLFLLRHIEFDFKEESNRLNQHFTQRAFEQEFGEEATYPQVAIGAKHIGNLKEVLQYMDRQGMLV